MKSNQNKWLIRLSNKYVKPKPLIVLFPLCSIRCCPKTHKCATLSHAVTGPEDENGHEFIFSQSHIIVLLQNISLHSKPVHLLKL